MTKNKDAKESGFLRKVLMSTSTKQNMQKYSQINPSILQAIGDKCMPVSSRSLASFIAKFYSKIGVLIRPDSYFQMTWQMLMIIVIFYYFIQIGMLMAFTETWWQHQTQYLVPLNIVFLVLLFLDILMGPLRAFYDQGILLWIDILGILSILIPLATANINTTYIKILWILKIYSAVVIDDQIQRITQIHIYRNTAYRVLKLLVIFYIFAHFMSIGFFMVSYYIYQNNYYGPNTPNLVWIYNSQCVYQLILVFDWGQIYSIIIYFAYSIVTTIAYGDITPLNPIQAWYISGSLLLVAVLFAFIVAQILRIIIHYFVYFQERRQKHQTFLVKIQSQQLNSKLRRGLKGQLQQFQMEEFNRNRQKQQILLKFLPNEALYYILKTIYSSFLKRLKFQFDEKIENLSFHSGIFGKSIFLFNFIRDIKQKRFFIGDVIYDQGQLQNTQEHSHCVYFYSKKQYKKSVLAGIGNLPALVQGRIDNYTHLNRLSYTLGAFQQGFGQVQFFTGQPRSHWAFCAQNCILFLASRKNLKKHYDKLILEQKQLIFMNTQQISQAHCLVCGQKHHFKKCPRIFLQTDALDDIQKRQTRMLMIPNKKQNKGKLPGLRYKTYKSSHAWQLWPQIKDVKMHLSHQYKKNLFFQGIDKQLLMQDNMQNFQQEMQEMRLIIQKVQETERKEAGIIAQEWTLDQYKEYKYYKPEDNIAQVLFRYKKNNQKQYFQQ